MTTKVTIDRHVLKKDFENTLICLERNIVHKEEGEAWFCLGILQAIIQYSGRKLEDKLRYVSMVRLMNEAFNSGMCTDIECQFDNNDKCEFCNRDKNKTDKE